MNITLVLILITVGVSVWAWRSPSLMDSWVLNPYDVVHKNQYYRLLTSGFLHADFGHLFFNMFSLYLFGSQIEQIFALLFGASGEIYLVIFYLLAIVISDIPTLIRHRNDKNYNSLGASGGVSSIIFGAILFFPLNKVYLYGIIGFPGFIFGILYIGYSFYESRQNRGTINHDAHLYGALFGILFMAVVYPAVIPHFFEQVSQWKLF